MLNQVQYIFPWLDTSALLQYLLTQPNSLNLRLGKPPDHWHDLEVKTKITMMDQRSVILSCCSLLYVDMDYSSLEPPSSQFGDHFLHSSIRKVIKEGNHGFHIIIIIFFSYKNNKNKNKNNNTINITVYLRFLIMNHMTSKVYRWFGKLLILTE